MAFRALPAPAVRGLGTEDAEVAIAAREHGEVIAAEARERTGDGKFGPRPQQRAVIQIGRDVGMQVVVEGLLEAEALAPLVIHLLALVFQRGDRGRAFVGEHNGVVSVEDGRQREDRRVDRGDRDVSVPRAEAVQFEQAGRQLARDVERRQSGAGGALRDQRRVAHPGGRRLRTDRLDRLDRHDGILAAADRQQRAWRQADLRRRRRSRGSRSCSARRDSRQARWR